jgi:hypothetical protein
MICHCILITLISDQICHFQPVYRFECEGIVSGPLCFTVVFLVFQYRHQSSSLMLNASSCQSSSQITAPVNSPSNYLIPILYAFIYLAPLHPSISTCTSIMPVFNWYIVIHLPPWRIYCLILPHLQTLYRDFFYCVIDVCLFYV